MNSDGLQDLVLSRREGTQVWLQTAPPLCQTDLGFGGELVLELCGGDLSTGSSAVLKVLGGVPASPLFLVIGTAANPTPIAGLGVTLVPDPMLLLLTLGTDSMGQLTSVIPGGGGPISLFAQAFQAPIVGPDWFSSNAIEAKFLP